MQPSNPPPWKNLLGTKERVIAILAGVVILFLLWMSYTPSFPDSIPHAGLTAEQEGPMLEQREFFKMLNRALRAHHGYLVITEETADQEEEGPRKFRQVFTKIDETLLAQTLQDQATEWEINLKMSRFQDGPALYKAIFSKGSTAWVQLSIQLGKNIKTAKTTKITSQITTPLAKGTEGPSPIANEKSMAKLVIIVDDIGQNLKLFRQFIQLHPNLTFSILPHLPYSRPAAQLAADLGLPVMLHLPMQPKGWPEINPGPGALLVDHSDAELLDKLELNFEEVPQAVGVNNHMGSALIQQESSMRQIMGSLARRGVFFLDSKTAPGAIAKKTAREAGVPFLSRDVFLDDDPAAEKVRAQFQKAVQIAQKRGYAIAICHPRPSTLKILRKELAQLEQAGITLVPVTDLLEVARSLSPR